MGQRQSEIIKNHMEVYWHDYASASKGVPITEAGLVEKASVIGRTGLMLLECGTGAWRVRSSMNTLSRELGVTTTADIGLLSIEFTCFDGDQCYTQSLCLTNTGVNTSRLNRLEHFVNDFDREGKFMTGEELHSHLDEIERIHGLYSPIALGFAAALACGCFTFLLGGGIVEMLCAFCGAGIGNFVRCKLTKHHFTLFLGITASVCSASLVYDLFSTEENRQEEQREQVQQIPIDALHPFTNHPFKVLDDEAMTRTVESIAQYGVLAPLIARPRPEGGYEIISGHRRQYAAKLAGLDTLPVIVRKMSDDAAVILMVDSNLQREHILPSERAFAYKMKLEALKNQGARSDLTSRQVVGKLEAADLVGKGNEESGRQVQRFIRLTNLIPELLDMVDEKKISFNPAVELSYLDESQQRDFLEAMDGTQNAPSVSQAQQLKKMAQCGEFTYEKAFDILGQEKKSEQDTVTIKNDILRKYFPRSYTPRQMEEKIIQLLDAWQQQRQQAKLKKRKQEAER